MAAADVLPSSIGRYEIVRLLGKGGMGEVFLATDPALGRRVAIKVLPAALQQDAKMRGRFMNEARAVAALNHPNVITLHDLALADERDAGFPPGALYLVLEYLEGKGLDEIMDVRRLGVGECVDIAIQVLEGLKAAHQNRILHRDITPANVMLAPDGRAKLLDFGLSKILLEGARDASKATRHTGEGMIVGTLDYLSPEQALGGELDERSDLFSFGIVFYQMLAGVHPFSGASVTQMVAKMMTKEADPWPEPDNVPDVVKQIVARALKKDASERYGSAGQMILDLLMARRELAARPARGAVTREVPAALPPPAIRPPVPPAVVPTSPGAALTESTAPMTRPKRTASLKPARSVRRGPLLLLAAAVLLLAAGGAALVAARGCARLAPAGAAGPR
ncbi:MAG: serine/threonine protein kinase [Acidobacteria bacterium]|nr:serine/threonine protein kinase [Acidobacteriota bacterium]